MFNDSVAQNPTMPVSDGKKKSANCETVENFDGCFKIGPSPCDTLMAQNNKARAAMGRKKALNTNSFLMLSTPRYTINIFNAQNNKKQMSGIACGNKETVSIAGNEWFHTRS